MPKTAFLFGSKRAEGNISAAQTSKTGLSAHGPKSKERSPSSLCICCEHFLHQGTPGCRTWDWIEALQVSLRDVFMVGYGVFPSSQASQSSPIGGENRPLKQQKPNTDRRTSHGSPERPRRPSNSPRGIAGRFFDIGGWRFCTC